MGHHLRKDNTCLNCGTIVDDRFCSHCGQENIETKESVGHLLRHFFDDVTHYDSKLLVTIKDLLIRPGFLTSQYLSGKRQSYLHPIRMYLFISFLYFLLIFSTGNYSKSMEEGWKNKISYDTRQTIRDSVEQMLVRAKTDTLHGTITQPLLHDVHNLLRLPIDSLQENFNLILLGTIDYKSLLHYDSVQQSLPATQKDSGIKPWLYKRWLKTIEQYGQGSIFLLIEKTRHVIPKLMFILLPLCALLLKLLHSKKYFYADHAVFTLHFHCAVFLLFLFSAIISLLIPATKSFSTLIEIPLMIVYFMLALRFVYQQSWFTTVLKSLVVAVVYTALLVIGMGVIAMAALL